MTEKTRSPLRESPLRVAGQSVQERLSELLDNLLFPVLAALFAIVLAVVEV